MSEIFTGMPGKFVNLNESISGFKALISGEGDEYPEAAFYMVGTLE
jgi:F0F1-type ATP synthase beta subunit